MQCSLLLVAVVLLPSISAKAPFCAFDVHDRSGCENPAIWESIKNRALGVDCNALYYRHPASNELMMCRNGPEHGELSRASPCVAGKSWHLKGLRGKPEKTCPTRGSGKTDVIDIHVAQADSGMTTTVKVPQNAYAYEVIERLNINGVIPSGLLENGIHPTLLFAGEPVAYWDELDNDLLGIAHEAQLFLQMPTFTSQDRTTEISAQVMAEQRAKFTNIYAHFDPRFPESGPANEIASLARACKVEEMHAALLALQDKTVWPCKEQRWRVPNVLQTLASGLSAEDNVRLGLKTEAFLATGQRNIAAVNLFSPLIHATLVGCVPIVQALANVQNRAYYLDGTVNTYDTLRYRALHYAARGATCIHCTDPTRAAMNAKSAEMMEILIMAGADIEAQTTAGETPILIAARYCNLRAVRLLLQHRAATVVQNSAGTVYRSVFQKARHQRDKTMREARIAERMNDPSIIEYVHDCNAIMNIPNDQIN